MQKDNFSSDAAIALKGIGKAFFKILAVFILLCISAFISPWAVWVVIFGAFYFLVVKPLDNKWRREHPGQQPIYYRRRSSLNPLNPSSPYFDDDF